MRKNPSRRSFVLPLSLITLACSSSVFAANSQFNGSWAYKQTCGQQHSASMRLTQKGGEVVGDWDDGSARGQYTDGHLKGKIKGGKLFVRYCGSDQNAGYSICPNYEPEETDYLVRQKENLVWYRMTGKQEEHNFEKYLILHPQIKGKSVALDSHCADD